MSRIKNYAMNVVIFFVIMTITTIVALGMARASQTKTHKKRGNQVQEVNFDGTDVDGKARKPDGSYLVQKKGVEFVPLYNVRTQFDQSIKESVDYLR